MALSKCPDGHLFSSKRHGNVCPYCSKSIALDDRKFREDPTGKEDGPTYVGDLEVMNPVTGWLVCTEGPNRGRDYGIKTEKNFVGRADGMDIQILGDNHIAKKNHATIAYDPKKRHTLVIPGDSQGLVYVNGEAIYTPKEINAYDTIEMGKSVFLFIPLCGLDFEWEELDEPVSDSKKPAPQINQDTSM